MLATFGCDKEWEGWLWNGISGITKDIIMLLMWTANTIMSARVSCKQTTALNQPFTYKRNSLKHSTKSDWHAWKGQCINYKVNSRRNRKIHRWSPPCFCRHGLHRPVCVFALSTGKKVDTGFSQKQLIIWHCNSMQAIVLVWHVALDQDPSIKTGFYAAAEREVRESATKGQGAGSILLLWL